MSATKEIRDKYQLSQPEMARFLGIGRSMLAMVETGKRSLPLEALKKLNRLAKTPETTSQPSLPAPKATASVRELACMRWEIKKILSCKKRKAAELELQLKKMCKTYHAQISLSAGLRRLQEANLKLKSKNSKAALHERHFLLLPGEMTACNPLKQSLLRIQLQALCLEIKLLEQLLKTPVSKGFSIEE